jgi:hypothetical protein
MTMSRREQLCSDTMILLGQEDQKFQWPRYYWDYSSMPFLERNKNIVQMFGISLDRCAPEVFYCKENVFWCANKFDQI